MATWYWMENDERQGPVAAKELKAMADAGRITPQTLVFREGNAEWVAAARVKGLFERAAQSAETAASAPQDCDDSSAAGRVFEATREQAAAFVSDLRSMNWREEILPVDEANLRVLLRDYVFWTVLLAGIVPALIGTIRHSDVQLTLYGFFFAALWGVVFRDFIVQKPAKWKVLVASACFTAFIGIHALLLVYALILPDSYVSMSLSSNGLVSLVGYVLQVGVCEELCKAVPVVIYLAWKRSKADPLTAVLVGVFSGLGFAGLENILYRSIVIEDSRFWSQFGASGHTLGVEKAISNVMLRSLFLVFCHALWTGIVAYFLVMAFATRRRAPVLAVVGVGLAAVLHGSYDWLSELQMTFATLVVAGSFVLFYAYVTKLRSLLAGEPGMERDATVAPASGDNHPSAATAAIFDPSSRQSGA